MNIHSDALYLSKGNAHSWTCEHFFMGWMPQGTAPICINGAFHLSTNVIQFMIAFAAEIELGALFHDCQTSIIFCSNLKDMGRTQPRLSVLCNNALAVGIANRTVKWQCSRSIEMRFFSGLVTSVRKRCTHFTGIQDRRILRIIKASTTRARITQLIANCPRPLYPS
jgi:hypothetical protein